MNLLGAALKSTTGLSQNVSPIMEPDGSVKLMIKGPDNNTEASILSAPHWKGPCAFDVIMYFQQHSVMKKALCTIGTLAVCASIMIVVCADTLVHINIFAKYYADNITNEDCWWWRSNDGHYHALTHRMTPADREGVESGGHAFATSLDDCACHFGFSLVSAFLVLLTTFWHLQGHTR